MNVSAATSAPVRPSDTELFPYRLSLSGASAPKADSLVAVGALGDLCMILAGLVLGYWVRFDSGLIQRGNEPAGIQLYDYAGLIGLGSLFLMLTFGYLQLYNPPHDSGLSERRDDRLQRHHVLALRLPEPDVGDQDSAHHFPRMHGDFLHRVPPTVLCWRWAYSRILQTKAIATAKHNRHSRSVIPSNPSSPQRYARLRACSCGK